jgi:hypothetical protein
LNCLGHEFVMCLENLITLEDLKSIWFLRHHLREEMNAFFGRVLPKWRR